MTRLWRLPEDSYEGLTIRAAPGLHDAAFGLIEPHLHRCQSVLDLGAGSGAFSARLRSAGVQDIEVVELDVERFGVSDIPIKSFDLNKNFARELRGERSAVVALEIIEHLDCPRHFLQEIHSLLAADGLLLLSTPNIHHWVGRLEFMFAGRHRYFTWADYEQLRHVSAISNLQARIMLTELGFNIVTHLTAGSFWGPLKRLITSPAAMVARLLWGPCAVGDANIYLAQKTNADASS